jgi:hypothetical protein
MLCEELSALSVEIIAALILKGTRTRLEIKT